jgi:hypothetical protein
MNNEEAIRQQQEWALIDSIGHWEEIVDALKKHLHKSVKVTYHTKVFFGKKRLFDAGDSGCTCCALAKKMNGII